MLLLWSKPIPKIPDIVSYHGLHCSGEYPIDFAIIGTHEQVTSTIAYQAPESIDSISIGWWQCHQFQLMQLFPFRNLPHINYSMHLWSSYSANA
jgi:hypothetical protein